ncbi:transmembrane protein 241 isoform X7 [Betta splendens]|uniref:Transmembrane protein 241 isoform X7 n=1 Tax=Betta splendens TaxID=158456 RepID=A0A6P7M9Q6_BETSP|nr:transmembrane protein 241 isoform X7 [Betta splendens]
MQWRRHVTGCAFCFVFVLSNFTNKFVLSVLNFTYPTLFQGWQTLIGAVLLLLFAKLGWVEISRITRSAALSWLPASLLFVGNIYAGSKALSRIVRHNCTGSLTPDTDSFMSTGGVSPLAAGHSFLLHSSEFLSRGQLRYAEGGAEREDPVAQADQVRSFSSLLRIVMWFHTCFALITSRCVCLMLVSAANLLYSDPQLDHSGSMWAVFHLVCVVTLNSSASTTCSACCCWLRPLTRQGIWWASWSSPPSSLTYFTVDALPAPRWASSCCWPP